ncbi:DUF2935 domain-containing protein [Anaerosalibacter massiliensis]|uniref:DUF2935 domain-containing protein n=1 Tax=Anaerosalibacter massiliensis TaxID=1347392 RepID=A0A9X2MIJ3_9FIRM|nr:DUF2935 domain-containing protein [Anaerosalibacter massiliensis]MCR2044349.1 DUF2935 domain-containing protein [Anaerosalibacter massiliensis]
MLSKEEYIKLSLEYNLFFARIMKEHLIFIEASLPIKNSRLILDIDDLKKDFESFLLEIVYLANKQIGEDVLSSNELVTQYTLNAELLTEFYTGVCIDTDITKLEMNLVPKYNKNYSPELYEKVYNLNMEAINLVDNLIQLQRDLTDSVLDCKIFITLYPLLLEHTFEEAEVYLNILEKLQSLDESILDNNILKKEVFWNEIMEEHSMFIRGLLDPTEGNLINIANEFAALFEELTIEAKEALENNSPAEEITEKSLEATEKIKDFKSEATEGLLNCNIRSIIIPLLADHVLREAYYYLRILKSSN